MCAVQDLAFSVSEYRIRLAKVQSAMAAKELDVLLINNLADVCYLSGIETCYMVAYHATIIPAAGEPILLASDFEMLNALVSAWCKDRVTFAVTSNPIEATCKVLVERGFRKKRIGVQRESLTAEQYLAIQQRLPDATLVDAGDILTYIKVRKSRAEIAYMRRAGELTTMAMQAAMKEVAAGKTDNDVAAVAYNMLIGRGSEYMCIDPIVTVGERSGIPHSTFRRTLIQPGDSIIIEIGACIYRYSSPLMRTVVISPVPDEVRLMADACRDSLNVLIEHMRPGVVAGEVAAKAKAAWMPTCEELIWHGTYAYSVGLGFPPDWNDVSVCITKDSNVVLEPGMCFHATTSLRKAAKYGTAMSETVLITEEGNELLTGTERRLLVV